jgi:hypothetical protein
MRVASKRLSPPPPHRQSAGGGSDTATKGSHITVGKWGIVLLVALSWLSAVVGELTEHLYLHVIGLSASSGFYALARSVEFFVILLILVAAFYRNDHEKIIATSHGESLVDPTEEESLARV